MGFLAENLVLSDLMLFSTGPTATTPQPCSAIPKEYLPGSLPISATRAFGRHVSLKVADLGYVPHYAVLSVVLPLLKGRVGISFDYRFVKFSSVHNKTRYAMIINLFCNADTSL